MTADTSTTGWTPQPDGSWQAPGHSPDLPPAMQGHQPDAYGNWQPPAPVMQDPLPDGAAGMVAADGTPDWTSAVAAYAGLSAVAHLAAAAMADMEASGVPLVLPESWTPPG